MPAPAFSTATRAALAQLQERMHQIGGGRKVSAHPPVRTGCSGLDALLPAGGLQRGTLVEYFPATRNGSGHGLSTLAMLLAKALSADGGAVVVIDREKTFYAPAAVALGIPWPQLLVVQPQNAQDELWAIDQSLRCAGVAAVWAPLAKLGAHDFRRLQLAAESSEAVGLLLRDAPWRKEPSWAHVQLVVTPLAERKPFGESGRRLRVETIRIRGAKLNAAAKRTVVQIDEVTGQFRETSPDHVPHPVHSFPALAGATADRDTA